MTPCGRREEVPKEIGEDKRRVNKGKTRERGHEDADSKTSATESRDMWRPVTRSRLRPLELWLLSNLDPSSEADSTPGPQRCAGYVESHAHLSRCVPQKREPNGTRKDQWREHYDP